MRNYEQWNGFGGRTWKEEINVRDFIQKNYKPYMTAMRNFGRSYRKYKTSFGISFQALQKEERCKRRRSRYGYKDRIDSDLA